MNNFFVKNNNNNKNNNSITSKKGKYDSYPILVAGGAGYIGSHTIVELINNGFTNIVCCDNYCNSSPIALKRVEKITDNKIISYKKKNKK